MHQILTEYFGFKNQYSAYKNKRADYMLLRALLSN